ncbi:DUF2270 domain-containing protein [Halomicroarcula sp. F13]|uniref:DUF2270 domain-containing protein n=1 Tax=Haloarcula rubra TaxID=2487747 RepID=A0AAW4PS99_9EURY|nr:DUF2270 domain-containing protein [Halomicroarcula rubra]MBX0323039.1 DUF2270 domain-containing protein [Halomicroarcula rubra]
MSDEEFDPSGERERGLGAGLFERDMGPSSSMAHLYRGEVHRMTRWRERLDRTTNWAVTVIAAILTWAFSDPTNPHYLVLVGLVTLAVFLGIEAHRYRGFDVWRSRVRLVQQNVWAHGLDPSTAVDDESWRRKLSEDYREPTLKVPFEEALAHRLRRVYLALFSIVTGAWVIRVTAFAQEGSWPESAAIGMVPGVVVTAVVGLAYLAAVVVAVRPRAWHSRSELRRCEVDDWRET